jgi:hypothetical protein
MGIWHPAGMWALGPRRGHLVLTLRWAPAARGRRPPPGAHHCYMIVTTGPECPVLMLGRCDGIVGWLVYRYALL